MVALTSHIMFIPGNRLLEVSDIMDVGDVKSEIEHGYFNEGQHWWGKITQPYVDGTNLTLDGRAYVGKEGFYTTVEPGVDILLLKRQSTIIPSMTVDVTVDGAFAGTWNMTGAGDPKVSIFNDTLFTLPKGLVKRDRVLLEFIYVDGRPDVNSFMYTVGREYAPGSLLLRFILFTAVVSSVLLALKRMSVFWLPPLVKLYDSLFRPNGALLVPLAVLMIICSINYLPYLKNLDYWAQTDFAIQVSWLMSARDAILREHQLPLWNPYYCGGIPLLGYAESMFASPVFLPILALGVVGVRLATYLATVFGMMGFYLLARHLGMGRISSFLPPLIFLLNTQFQAKLYFGGIGGVYPAVFIPWVILYYLKACESSKYLPLAALSLGLMFLSGSQLYPFYLLIFLSAYALVRSSVTVTLRPLVVLALLGLLGFSLAAFKLVPNYEFLSINARSFPGLVEGYSVRMLEYALLMKPELNYILYYHLPEQMWGWHEYTAYIGYMPILLALLGAVSGFREKIPFAAAALLMLVLSMGHQFPGFSLWDAVRNLPMLSSSRVPERMILLAFVGVSVLAGYGLTMLEKRSKALAIMLLLFMAYDLIDANKVLVDITFSSSTSEQYWVGKPRQESFYQEVHPQDALSAVFRNVGDVNCYSGFDRITQSPVIPKYINDVANPAYRGEAFLLYGRGSSNLTYFSHNVIDVDLNLSGDDILIINQNYYPGWRVFYGGTLRGTYNGNGLIAVDMHPGLKSLRAFYLPDSLLIGICLTFASASMLVLMIRRGLHSRLDAITSRLDGIVARLNPLKRGTSRPDAAEPGSLSARRLILAVCISLAVGFAAHTLGSSPPFYTDDLQGLTQPGYTLIDTLDVGDQVSEAEHRYDQYLCDITSNRTLSYPDGTLVSDSGRSCRITGYEVFNVRSVPGHDIILLRRIDDLSKNSGIRLIVFNSTVYKENLVGYIFIPGEDHALGWRDVRIIVPKEYVSDGDFTRIEMTWGSGLGLASYNYRAYVAESSGT